MKETLKRLKEITKECRDDMHEPDEQDIEAEVIGTHLDNAMGDMIIPEAIEKGFQELVVIIFNRSEGKWERFNLATLIALARKAKL